MSAKENIVITFPDGNSKPYPSGITPAEIAKDISRALARNTVTAKIDGKLVDLGCPILKDSSIEIVTIDTDEGMSLFWHSTSHIMAHAIKNLYPEAQFGVGPAIENGFYYDIDINRQLSVDDLGEIEAEMKKIVANGTEFRREDFTREAAIALFEDRKDQYKIELLTDLDDDFPSVYWEGDFVDLCRGPHLPSTKLVKHFKLLSIAGAYWRGSEKNKMLQRIYGISFPKKSQLDDYLHFLEEARKRDHRKIGRELDLFSIQPEGPGFIFWHPRGMVLYNQVENYLREKLIEYGYQEIKTPTILNEELWRKSGHWDNYKDNMYFVNIDNADYAIKPMNCPGACLVYRNTHHSYRELPLRYAEFGNVHRHERSGVLNGLFRVRQFTQDDAHIYCTAEQVRDEVISCIRFIEDVYKDFQFTDYRVELSTKPEKAIGSTEMWNQAEDSLEAALKYSGLDYQVNEGDGAFYGPKIDFHVRDSLRRSWQLGTVQLDFSMPERFKLEYTGPDGQKHRPVLIHRAILGSVERFLAQLVEHYAGSFPAWLAPVQARVIPITESQKSYSREIFKDLKKSGFRVEIDERNEKIGYKIREAEKQKIPFMLVIGKAEVETGMVTWRQHKKGDMGKISLVKFKTYLEDHTKNKK